MTETAGSLAAPARGPALSRLILYSLLGLLVFFVPIELAGRSTIALDHAATAIVAHARPVAVAFCLPIAYGAVAPLLDGSWRKSPAAPHPERHADHPLSFPAPSKPPTRATA